MMKNIYRGAKATDYSLDCYIPPKPLVTGVSGFPDWSLLLVEQRRLCNRLGEPVAPQVYPSRLGDGSFISGHQCYRVYRLHVRDRITVRKMSVLCALPAFLGGRGVGGVRMSLFNDDRKSVNFE